MRVVRYLREGRVRVAVERPHSVDEMAEPSVLDVIASGGTATGASVPVTDTRRLELDGVLLLAPVDPPEVWCAGVTYERSRAARAEESAVVDVYAMAYAAERPELFLKDAMWRRTVGPGQPIGIRGDARWTVPEPEIALVLGERGSILGFTIGNDVSARDIEGANPLYLPQAKTYAAACAIGPSIYVPARADETFDISMRIADAEGAELYFGTTTTSLMTRRFEELAWWLVRDNPVPAGSVLLTGTGLVPPATFTLQAGHSVEIHVPQIGTLRNHCVAASSLVERAS